MGSLPKQDQEILLTHARDVIAACLSGRNVSEPPLSPSLKEHRGCFVTLHAHGRLRGCIGTIEPTEPLINAVSRNARNAAFSDPRFPSVSAEELPEIAIEISVLTPPRSLDFLDPEDLKHKLKPGIHGVILSHGTRSAVFLPQVWKQLPDTERFLENLCMKCGLPQDTWRKPGTKISIYEAEYFSEK